MDARDLCALVEERREELFRLLGELIRIDSQSFASHGNEEACARYIANLCREMGLETDLYSPLDIPGFTEHAEYIPGRSLENRPCVTAVYPGKSGENALMVMGHIDTVPIGDRSLWTVDPLGGELRDGKIWGRGANDDKNALAACLFLMRLLKEENVPLSGNLLFTGYSDEEYGGSHGALAAVLRHPAQCTVNLDCRGGELWHCASGGQRVHLRFHAKEPVDSAKLAADALPLVLEEIERFAARRRAEMGKNPFYRGTLIPQTALRYMSVRAGGMAYDMGVGEVVFAFYTDRPRDEIQREYADLEQAVAKRLAPLGLASEGITGETRFFHYAWRDPDDAGILAMREVARLATGKDVRVCGSCLSDLSMLMKYGGQSVFSFGFGRDFSEKGGAHQADEYLECEQLLEDTKTLGAFILNRLG